MNTQTQEALKMAIDWFEGLIEANAPIYNEERLILNACKEALEQPFTRDWKETINERIVRDSEFKEALEQPAQPLDVEIINHLYDMAHERDGDAFDFDHTKFARLIEEKHGIGGSNE